MLRTMYRSLSLLALAGLAACGDSTAPVKLTPEQVSAFYDVCSLSFVPVNSTQQPVTSGNAAFPQFPPSLLTRWDYTYPDPR